MKFCTILYSELKHYSIILYTEKFRILLYDEILYNTLQWDCVAINDPKATRTHPPQRYGRLKTHLKYTTPKSGGSKNSDSALCTTDKGSCGTSQNLLSHEACRKKHTRVKKRQKTVLWFFTYVFSPSNCTPKGYGGVLNKCSTDNEVTGVKHT